MKLQNTRFGTIPKKLVLLLTTLFLFVGVMIGFNTKVFANENYKVGTFISDDDTFTDIDLYVGDYLRAYSPTNKDWWTVEFYPGSYNPYPYSGDSQAYITYIGIALFDGVKIDFEHSPTGGGIDLESGEHVTQMNIYPDDLEIEISNNFGEGYRYVNDIDSVRNTTEFFLEIISYNPKIDGKEPVISGETTFVSNVNDPKDASYFMQYLSAYDETDGDVTDSLKIIADNYTANKKVLGNHTFTVEASDLSGNKTTAVLNVRVVDIDAPVIDGSTQVARIGYKETWSIENFRKLLTVTDNYDNLTNADIKVKTDGYTTNKGKLGTYNVVYHAKDSSGNEGTFTKPVQVYDNVKPTFSGPTVISTSNNTILTESDVRAQITAHDEIDGNLTSKIVLEEDKFTGNGNKVGSYTIKYSVTDTANNKEYFTVTINRIDKLPPTIWVVDGVSIRTTADTPLTHDIIIDILRATGQVDVASTTTFKFLLDEYTGFEDEPGIYAMSVQARSTNGNESVHNLSVVVYETDDGGIDVNPDFDLGVFIKDNYQWFIVGAVVLIGVGYFIFRNKKNRKRR